MIECSVWYCHDKATYKIRYTICGSKTKMENKAFSCKHHLNEFENHLVVCKYPYSITKLSDKEMVVFT